MSQSAVPGPEPEPPERVAQVLHGPWPTLPAGLRDPEPARALRPAPEPVCLEDLPPARPTEPDPLAGGVHCRAHWSSDPDVGGVLIVLTIVAAIVVGLILRWTVFAPIGVG